MGRNNLQYGGVSKSNIIFEWVSESTACDACKSLDGTRYKDTDDVPEKPHPNCKCFVKDIYIGGEDYEALQREIDKIYGDLSSLRDQISTSMNEDESDIQNPEIQDILDEVYAFEYDLDEVTEDMEQTTEDEDSTERFQSLKAKIDEMKSAFQELKQKIIDKINSLKKEVCDCFDSFKNFEEALSDAENAKTEAEGILNEINDILDNMANYSDAELTKFEEYENEAELMSNEAQQQIQAIIGQAEGAITAFASNYYDMKALKETLGHYVGGADEYYHTKANCRAAQLGDVASSTAALLGYTREFLDFFKEILFKGKSIKDAFQYGLKDLESNRRGRALGKENPYADPRDIIKRPEEIPEIFW